MSAPLYIVDPAKLRDPDFNVAPNKVWYSDDNGVRVFPDRVDSHRIPLEKLQAMERAARAQAFREMYEQFIKEHPSRAWPAVYERFIQRTQELFEGLKARYIVENGL